MKEQRKFDEGIDRLNHIQWIALILCTVFGLMFSILGYALYY
jgi:hypothetical protein